jgi:hypothetical protein
MKGVASLFSSPELCPVEIDTKESVARFVCLSRLGYVNSAFLDNRILHDDAEVYQFRLDELLSHTQGCVPQGAVPVHYIFHTAFCCSTLLARYLEAVRGCLVLKEPQILTQLALGRPKNSPGPRWSALFRCSMELLSRSFEGDRAVIVKTNDRCTGLAELLLQSNPNSRFLCLSLPLKIFLLSVLKSESRRLWLRERLSVIAGDARLVPGLPEVDLSALSDAEAGTYLWMVNHGMFERLRSDPRHQPRVEIIDGEMVANSPRSALNAVLMHFGLSVVESELSCILADRPGREYSKDVTVPYDANSRRAELKDLTYRLNDEAAGGAEWARKTKLGCALLEHMDGSSDAGGFETQ